MASNEDVDTQYVGAGAYPSTRITNGGVRIWRAAALSSGIQDVTSAIKTALISKPPFANGKFEFDNTLTNNERFGG